MALYWLFMKSLIFLILGLVILSACQTPKTTGLSIANVDLCDDNNPCTLDSNLGNNKCSNVPLESCCGNNKCEVGEGCNSITKTTKCKNECSSCPAEITVKTLGCKGECMVNQDKSIKISGNSQIDFEIENSGEENADLNAEFNCVKTGSQIGSINFAYYGLNVESSPSLTLNGKSKNLYSLFLTGKPRLTTSFECSINILHKNNIIIETVFLRLEN